MSEKKKTGGDDPFTGLDWDSELESGDKSADAPGSAEVPESFSKPLPTAAPAQQTPPESQRIDTPNALRQSRPLYRPPPAAGRASGATPPPRPGPPRPGPPKLPAFSKGAVTMPEPDEQTVSRTVDTSELDRNLPSLIEDEPEDSQAKTRASDKPEGEEHYDENATVVAPVSADLLAQLEAAGIRRPGFKKKEPAKPPAPRAAAPPVDIDVGMDEAPEHTEEHPAPEPEDPSVVTSAPDYVRHARPGRGDISDARPAPRAADKPGAGGMYDPFAGMDVEPAVSETVGRDAEAPKLLQPDVRRHSADEETAVFDKKQMSAALGGLPAASPRARQLDADATTPEPFHTADPFATADPFEREGDAPELAASEEYADAAVIDLLRGDDMSSDGLPAVTDALAIERTAADWLGDQADKWVARAEHIAADARTLEKAAKARGLVVASEVMAIAGDRPRAIELAEEAWNAAPNDPLAVRQLRQLLAADGRWDDVTPLLEAETKTAASPLLKSHAALLSADAARLARSSPDEAAKLYELAQRTASSDPRPTIARAVAAVSAAKPLPVLKWSPGMELFGEAVARRARSGEPVEDVQLATIFDGIATYADGSNVEGAFAHALDELAQTESLAPAALWLRFSLDAARTKTRNKALEKLADLPAGRAKDEARLGIALDLGDASGASAAAHDLARAYVGRGTVIAREATRLLAGEDASIDGLLAFAREPGVSSVARAIALTRNEDAPAEVVASDPLDASARVARRLAVGGHVDVELRTRTPRGAQLGFALADALGGGGPRATIDAIGSLLAWDDGTADASLARMLAELAESDAPTAIESAREAANVEPTSFPAVLALLGLGAEDGEQSAVAAAEGTPDEARGAALALRITLAGIRRNDLEGAKRSAEIALQNAPTDAVATFLAELRARRAGDFDAVVEAIRQRTHASNDPVARASNLVREIFLLLGTDLATCIDRAGEAADLVPRDITMRALYERIAGEGAQGRAEWRAQMAETLTGVAKSETLLDAAREAERRGDLDNAEKLAFAAEAAGSGAEASSLRHRVQARGDGASRLAEELLDAAKKTDDPAVQRELYEALADLDLFARGDTPSAIMWHQAILETTPQHLPSLRRLEHLLLSVGREDDYEYIATQLAHMLPKDARDAHAEVATRLRLRRPGVAWDSIADLAITATERENPSLWATRLLDALARTKGDDASILRAVDLLLARLDRPAEVAALATRGAEAAFRAGDPERARAYLERALENDPQHPTALASLAELRRLAGDWRGAAETIEAQAQTQLVAEHRLEDWHAAACIWLDKVSDEVRGRAALERASEIDLGYADIFDRLVAMARASRENEIVADLYQRRLGQIEEPQGRAQLQVAYARVLVELGDRDGARVALTAALETLPTHAEALEEALRLAEEAQDWPEYEQHLIRLSKAQPDHDLQMHVLRRLGALYEGPLPNPSRAEAVYRKILAQDEGNDEILARLVAVYLQLGDADMAVETHQERVQIAVDPPLRRVRLIELAKLLDEKANQPERALKALEQARGSDPSDLDALSALAQFHTKHGRPDAVAAALDDAIRDLRRRVGNDPGDLALLDQLAKILELRGRGDAVSVVRAATAFLRGEIADLVGAEDAASLPELDRLLCPPEITTALRAFFEKTAESIEKSIPVDLRMLKAAKLGANNPALKAKIDAVSRGFGLPDPDVVISRAMPLLCLPVGFKPLQIVLGDGIVTTEDEITRKFVLARAVKVCGAKCAVLVRVPPADLKINLDALLHHLNPDHPAPELEPERLDEMTKRLARFLPRKEEAELKQLAIDVGSVDVDKLAAAAATWGDRVALLCIGDLSAGLRGVAWTLGQKDPPQDPDELRRWLRDNPAARDLVAFAVSDEYVEARRIAGV